MQAVICTKYGPPEVLVLGEVEKPVPKDREIQIRICATVVSSGDCRIWSLNLEGVPFIQRILARLVLGVFKPRNPILGLWLAGEVEMTGSSVQKFKVGDKVYARTPNMKFGAYAEYICLSEKEYMTIMPTNLTYQEAVSIPFGGVTALYFLTKNKLQKGQKIMIYGLQEQSVLLRYSLQSTMERRSRGFAARETLSLCILWGRTTLSIIQKRIMPLKPPVMILFLTQSEKLILQKLNQH